MASNDVELENKIKALNLNDKTDINILLLGETGVGKSTFINAIANYLTHTNLKDAEQGNLHVLIPSKCNVQDKNGEYHIIKIGSEQDENEYLDTGVSATQDVKTYVFPIWGGQTKVRLIDTPGMGDTRGIQQDDINCENILSYIGQLHELHAICFLFRPTNSRITKFFGYCMSQILSRLDKTASKNIIFIFTNTRGSDYGPGDTFPVLQQVVKDIEATPPNVKIPFNRNIFCFDNEVFKYLAATKQNIEYDDATKRRYKESWKKSLDQCWGLIKYIVGDKKNPPLKPHFIKSTNAINEARRMIVQLSQPLAEITELINENIYALQRHEQYLDVNKDSLEELRKKLYMPVINLDVIKLTQPVTVCASSKCAEIYKVGDTNKWHYKQRCHDPCYLTNVPKEIIGSPELVNCAAMDASKKCTKCTFNCDFSVHMHIYYMTKTKEDRVIDDNIQRNINSKEHVLLHARKLIDDMSQRKEELEKEHDVIVRCCARFAHFLQNNAITPFSDFYKEYIEYLIIRERSLGVLANMGMIQQLQKLIREYEEAKKSFDEALQLQKKIGESVLVTPQKINETIQELYRLKHNGQKIKELYECQKKSRSKEHEYAEYVHKVVSVQSAEPATKKKNKKEGEEQKAPQKTQQKKPTQKPNTRTDNRADNPRQRSRPRTPPPSYHDTTRHMPPPPFHYPPQASGSYYPPPPPVHPPNPYTPPTPGADPYNYNLDYSRDDGASAYEFSISVNKRRQQAPPPQSPSYYGQSSPNPPPHGSYHPPPGPYPPQHGAYAPPQHGAYAPPQHGAYAPPPPPPGSYPHYRPPAPGAYKPHRGPYHPQQSRQYGTTDNQNASQQRGRGRGRGGRGGRGRGGVNKYQKYKQGHKKQGSQKGSDDSDSDSDSFCAL